MLSNPLAAVARDPVQRQLHRHASSFKLWEIELGILMESRPRGLQGPFAFDGVGTTWYIPQAGMLSSVPIISRVHKRARRRTFVATVPLESPPPLRVELGRGVTPGIPFVVPFSLLWERLDQWNWAAPPPAEGRGDPLNSLASAAPIRFVPGAVVLVAPKRGGKGGDGASTRAAQIGHASVRLG